MNERGGELLCASSSNFESVDGQACDWSFVCLIESLFACRSGCHFGVWRHFHNRLKRGLPPPPLPLEAANDLAIRRALESADVSLSARRDPEACGHRHQVGERVRVHFSHHLASVCLHRDLANAELEPDLFIQQARDDQRHDLPLAATE
jgi:hypothetical protein